MRGPTQAIQRGWTALALATGGLACGDPCRELSEMVCECELEPVARRTCLSKVALRAGVFVAPSDGRLDAAQRNNCAQLLGTCSCERLAAGDTAACGLSLPTASPTP